MITIAICDDDTQNLSETKEQITAWAKEQDIETEDPFACYEGDWGGNMSAEEYADDLRKP